MTVNVNSSFYFHATNGTTYEPFTAFKITSAVVLLLTFVFGLVVNTLYIWVLWFRIKKTMCTIYFCHLILANLFFTAIIPFVAVHMMMEPHWIFGQCMCKIINSSLSISMYASVFVLTAISVNRYQLLFHPHWCRRHVNVRYTTIISLVIWTLAFLFSSPYLVFWQLEYNDHIAICKNDFTFSGKLNGHQLKWVVFGTRLFGGFFIPLAIITVCYVHIFIKLKTEGLARSSKPYKVIIIAILSFFISWTPYHIWYGMTLEKEKFQEGILQLLKVLTVCFTCFNSCFTPILYLFIVENFKKMFKKSIFNVIESVIIGTVI